MSQTLDRKLKRHDTGPPVRAQLLSRVTRDPVPLNNAAGVTFFMYAADGTQLVSAPAVVEAPADAGIVRYDWAPGDTSTVGNHRGEFQVDYLDGTKETYPNQGYIAVKISADLDNA